MVAIEEIKKAINFLGVDWQTQTNYLDSETNFIYKSNTIDEVIEHCKQCNVEQNYALHRWYNFNCSRVHENFFIKLGAKKEQNCYHKTIDFYLFDVPFDLKTTYFPKAIKDKGNYNLTNRVGKNNLIKWLYDNQSTQGRFHLENRLFIVCENLESKSDFETIENRVNQFVNYSKQNGFNQISFDNVNVFSDIIWIPK